MAAEGLTRADLARALGQTRAAVTRTLAILTLDQGVLEAVRHGGQPAHIRASDIWGLLRAKSATADVAEQQPRAAGRRRR